jgi:hypothetical protein
MEITDYERLLWVLAEEMDSSIYSCFSKVKESYEWVESQDEAESLGRRLRGIFIASLVGEIEEKIGVKFSSVFEKLSDIPTTQDSGYWFEHMPESSTPRGRAKVMWAIRIAYTHGNGNISQIGDPKIKEFLEQVFVNKHFKGIKVVDDVVTGLENVPYPAIKTVLEIENIFSYIE